MENFEDMCNMKEAFHWLEAKILKMEVSTGSILHRRAQMVSFRWAGDGPLIPNLSTMGQKTVGEAIKEDVSPTR